MSKIAKMDVEHPTKSWLKCKNVKTPTALVWDSWKVSLCEVLLEYYSGIANWGG